MKRPWATTHPALVLPEACPPPTRCPYCPADAPKHWKKHGRYQRYAGDSQEPSRQVDVSRYWCKLVRRTFSIPPDTLLPYCGTRTGHVLDWLDAVVVQGLGLNTVARRASVSRGLLRSLKARFLRTLPRLRLPGREGMLAPRAFLTAFADAGAIAVAALFRGWKEREPKLAILGIYQR